jgi:hypothetical protein
MALTTAADPLVDSLYRVAKGKVEFVDVPQFGFVMIDGVGAPGGTTFTDAIQALYSVSYGAHFSLKKSTGAAPRAMALEALWWVEGADAMTTMQRIVAGQADMSASDRQQWHWRMMIAQLPPIDDVLIAKAIADAKVKKPLVALDTVRFERWTEGRSAQIMHIGPYATELTSIVALHRAIGAHGSHPRGYHHEIYLGDPRRAAPEKLRTILRQPITDGSW